MDSFPPQKWEVYACSMWSGYLVVGFIDDQPCYHNKHEWRSHQRRLKNYESHTIACVHNILHVNCSTGTYFFSRLSMKVAKFWNNKKKDWFLPETRLVFVLGDIFKDWSRNSATFKMELFATVGNDRVYNQWTVVFACWCGNLTSFLGEIKIGWKESCLEGSIRYDFLFCRPVFIFFRKCQFLFH